MKLNLENKYSSTHDEIKINIQVLDDEIKINIQVLDDEIKINIS